MNANPLGRDCVLERIIHVHPVCATDITWTTEAKGGSLFSSLLLAAEIGQILGRGTKINKDKTQVSIKVKVKI